MFPPVPEIEVLMARHPRPVPRAQSFLSFVSLLLVVVVTLIAPRAASAQESAGAGAVTGTVTDPTGGVLVSATVTITNPVTGLTRTETTDGTGKFAFRNLPYNPYHVVISAQGFESITRDVDVRSGLPVNLAITLPIGGATTSVEVTGEDLIEQDPTAHTDVDQSLVARLPVEAASGLNQAITLAAPGIVADSNGFFHPIGDHAQTQFAIDNQPVTDQQSRVYSNQISSDAVQSMEVVTGVAPAEYGGKSSLVVQIVTKSGLDQPKPTGSASFSFGSFTTPTADANVGIGAKSVGNFASFSGLRTDRYLDTPEFDALHADGHSASFFDRFDTRSTSAGALHVNVQAARSSFDIPNTFDQAAAGQDQHQDITSYNVAPGYSRVLNPNTVFTANAYLRQDRVNYAPSDDPFADTPATMAQHRQLRDSGLKVDLAYVRGRHNVKVGGTIDATALDEHFALGLTDPTFNAPCADADGNPSDDTTVMDPAECGSLSLVANDAFVPGLLPFDLSRGGVNFVFDGSHTIKTQAVYIQDEIKAGPATFNLGLRADHYDGLTTASLVEPRLGVAVQARPGTILRASFGRTLETPYNENLLLSSATGTNGLADSVFGAETVDPLHAGTRREFEIGVQQGFGSWVVADLSYLRKHTTNAYDFDVLFDTPIVFPISWDHSEISSISGRVNLVPHHGLSAFTVFGHNVARFYNPENGGVLFDSPLPDGVFRIDHDQAFQQTTNVQYVIDKSRGVWVGGTWRYDSGLVAGDVPDYASALALGADDQAAIGLYCGSTFATPTSPITSCDLADRGATRLRIPADGTEDDDTNPPRIAPRHLFDVAVGIDNLFAKSQNKVKVQLSVINLANTIALYNFHSTFSGTHFVTPRTVKVTVGVTF
jgi:hypothetical protein